MFEWWIELSESIESWSLEAQTSLLESITNLVGIPPIIGSVVLVSTGIFAKISGFFLGYLSNIWDGIQEFVYDLGSLI